jgi:hypothetical protein
MKKISLLLLSPVFLWACQNSTSGDLHSPEVKSEFISENGGSIEFEITPKAEILFVVDNSASMSAHIDNVSKNIDRFVDAFTLKNPIEYNLAIVSVHDSRTYTSAKYLETFKETPAAPLGLFRSIKRSQTETVENKTFISSKDENLKDLLKNSLRVGVQGLAEGGPEVEEAFSPVAKVFGLNQPPTNSNFFMGKDSYKIIFFVTDATDASNISASELYLSLLAQAGGDSRKVMAFGAIVPSGAKNCRRDPGNSAEKIEEFLRLTHKPGETSNVVSLCGNFGTQFAEFGKAIKNRTAEKVIPLNNRIPVISEDPAKSLRVFYGAQEILMERTSGIKGFTYSPSTNSIHLNPDLELEPQAGAKLRVDYTAVHPLNIRNGRVKRFGE